MPRIIQLLETTLHLPHPAPWLRPGRKPVTETLAQSVTHPLWWLLLLGLSLAAPATTLAEVGYEKLKDFGNAPLLGERPNDPLLLGSDGAFYGTTSRGGNCGAGTVFKLNQDGTGYQVLHSFGLSDDGRNPGAGLIEATNGFLYGTTRDGKTYGAGVLFQLAKDGTGYQVLHTFDGAAGGSSPAGRLTHGPDGALYGTTEGGGTADSGTVFRLDLTTHSLSILYHFRGFSADGRHPSGSLVLGNDGALYGTTPYGGAFDNGTIFRLTRDGNTYSILRTFSWGDGKGQFPNQLLEASDGMLYGTTSYGGSQRNGTVFRISKTGSGFTSLFSFTAEGPCTPYAPFLEGEDGFLYSTTLYGGTYKQGTVFRIAKDGASLSVLHHFGTVAEDGQSVFGGLTKGALGMLYGVAGGGRSGSGICFRLNPQTAEYSILRQFSPSGDDARNPASGLLEAQDQRLYGFTSYGGQADAGTVFRLSSEGTAYEILHHFAPLGEESRWPSALVAGSDGWLYGTASGGGSAGSGTLFRLARDGHGYALLYSFQGSSPDGRTPNGLIEARDGFLYGTTAAGGSSNAGTIFRIAKDGSGYGLLHSFGTDTSDGMRPLHGVIETSEGTLYGTTSRGGDNAGGTVFKLNRDGSGYAIVMHFAAGGQEFDGPSGLTEGSDGWLYGTHSEDVSPYFGSVFKLSKAGTGYTILHVFGGDGVGGNWPRSGVLEAKNGWLYGTTSYKGSAEGGTLFKLAKDGTGFSTLYAFGTTTNDGMGPIGHLLEASDGRLYGATAYGGATSLGTLFRLTSTELTRVRVTSANGARALSWNAIDGVRYRVQYRSALTETAWTDLPGDITAQGSTASKIDNDLTVQQRFYRVIVGSSVGP